MNSPCSCLDGKGKRLCVLPESKAYVRMGSTPPPEHVSRPVGQPEAGEASGAVSDTESPDPEHPPWKV